VAAPDDTPQFFTRSSVSFRNHWLVFHQSLTLFFLRCESSQIAVAKALY
jgi:hypothetical protein